jgi:hypothetical protein
MYIKKHLFNLSIRRNIIFQNIPNNFFPVVDSQYFFLLFQPTEKFPGSPEIFEASVSGRVVDITSGKVVMDCDSCENDSLSLKCRFKVPASVSEDQISLVWAVAGVAFRVTRGQFLTEFCA